MPRPRLAPEHRLGVLVQCRPGVAARSGVPREHRAGDRHDLGPTGPERADADARGAEGAGQRGDASARRRHDDARCVGRDEVPRGLDRLGRDRIDVPQHDDVVGRDPEASLEQGGPERATRQDARSPAAPTEPRGVRHEASDRGAPRADLADDAQVRARLDERDEPSDRERRAWLARRERDAAEARGAVPRVRRRDRDVRRRVRQRAVPALDVAVAQIAPARRLDAQDRDGGAADPDRDRRARVRPLEDAPGRPAHRSARAEGPLHHPSARGVERAERAVAARGDGDGGRSSVFGVEVQCWLERDPAPLGELQLEPPHHPLPRFDQTRVDVGPGLGRRRPRLAPGAGRRRPTDQGLARCDERRTGVGPRGEDVLALDPHEPARLARVVEERKQEERGRARPSAAQARLGEDAPDAVVLARRAPPERARAPRDLVLGRPALAQGVAPAGRPPRDGVAHARRAVGRDDGDPARWTVDAAHDDRARADGPAVDRLPRARARRGRACELGAARVAVDERLDLAPGAEPQAELVRAVVGDPRKARAVLPT